MDFIKRIFKGNGIAAKKVSESNINWISLTSLSQLEQIKEQSKSEAVVIFKHSTRCVISKMVIELFEKSFDEEMKNFKVYYLDLLNYRDISNEIGRQFQVPHQSPQLLIINKGEAVEQSSHHGITEIDLRKYM